MWIEIGYKRHSPPFFWSLPLSYYLDHRATLVAILGHGDIGHIVDILSGEFEEVWVLRTPWSPVALPAMTTHEKEFYLPQVTILCLCYSQPANTLVIYHRFSFICLLLSLGSVLLEGRYYTLPMFQFLAPSTMTDLYWSSP